MKIKDYFTPKSMIYSGKHQNKKTQINHYTYNKDNFKLSHDLNISEEDKHYIQVVGLTDIEKISQIREMFDIEELIFEDIFNVTQREKIDIRDHYIFSVVHALFKDTDTYKKEYMSLLCIDNVIITFHEDDPEFLETTIKALETYKELREKSSDFLFYHILDLITDNHIDLFDELNFAIGQFEDITLNEQVLPQDEFYHVRKAFIRLKNNVFYLLESLESFMNHKHPFVKDTSLDYFHDLIDHLNRLDTQINLARENLRNLVDVNMNNHSNKMNKIMTTLTLFSAIFIPLSFLTGFFGMNFVHFEILSYEYAVLFFIGFCILLIVFMVWFFKKRDWL